MTDAKPPANPDPLHGVTLEAIVTALVESFGWEELGSRIQIRCFTEDPSIPSSLKFLRKTTVGTRGATRHFSELPSSILEEAGRSGRADDMTVVAIKIG